MDMGIFKNKFIEEWSRWKDQEPNIETRENILRKACLAGKIRGNRKKKGQYWWTEELAVLRDVCLKTRRKHKKEKEPTCRGILWEEYQTAKRALKNAIKTQKKVEWKKLCEELEEDILGQGYKIAMRRIRCGGSPISTD